MKNENNTTAFEDNEIVVTYQDTPELRQRVFEKVLDWFKYKQFFSGESVMQCDPRFESGHDLLCDIVDDIFQFDVQNKE